MIVSQLPDGESIFLDVNTLVYALGPHLVLGPACKQLLERIEKKLVQGFTSAHVLLDVSHRMMTLEAISLFGWPQSGVANRLKRHPGEIPKLTHYRQAIDELSLIGVQIIPVTQQLVSRAVDACQ